MSVYDFFTSDREFLQFLSAVEEKSRVYREICINAGIETIDSLTLKFSDLVLVHVLPGWICIITGKIFDAYKCEYVFKKSALQNILTTAFSANISSPDQFYRQIMASIAATMDIGVGSIRVGDAFELSVDAANSVVRINGESIKTARKMPLMIIDRFIREFPTDISQWITVALEWLFGRNDSSYAIKMHKKGDYNVAITSKYVAILPADSFVIDTPGLINRLSIIQATPLTFIDTSLRTLNAMNLIVYRWPDSMRDLRLFEDFSEMMWIN